MLLLNFVMCMVGLCEVVWYGIICKNYGCIYIIIGCDYVGFGKNLVGEDFYGLYDVQEMFCENVEEIGIEMVDFKYMVYVQECV